MAADLIGGVPADAAQLVELVELEYGGLVLPYLTLGDAAQLRRVCRRLRTAVAAHRWDDRSTIVYDLGSWRRAFPRATVCRLGRCTVTQHDLLSLRQVRWIIFEAGVEPSPGALRDLPRTMHIFSAARCLDLWQCHSLYFTDRELQQLSHVRQLMINADSVSDAGVIALSSVVELRMLTSGVSRITDRGLTSLRHIVQLDLMGAHVLDMGACTRAGFIWLAPTLRRLRLQSIPNLHLDDSVFSALELESLFLDECPLVTLSDVGLAALASIQVLHLIYMPGFSCTDWGISQLAGIEVLQIYGGGDVDITDDGVAALSGIRILQLSNLNSVRVTDDGIMAIAGASMIDLSGCPLVCIQGWGLSALMHCAHLDISRTGSSVAPEIVEWLAEAGTTIIIDDEHSDDFIDDDFIGDDFIGDDFIGDDFIGDDFIGDDFIGDDFIGDDNAFDDDNVDDDFEDFTDGAFALGDAARWLSDIAAATADVGEGDVGGEAEVDTD